MHPERHAGRRRARTQALARIFGDGTTETPVLYTDAARYPGRRAMCLAVNDNTDALKVSTTVLTADSGSAEEAAIALAIVHASILPTYDSPITIVTDSQAACRAFAQGLPFEQSDQGARRALLYRGAVGCAHQPEEECNDTIALGHRSRGSRARSTARGTCVFPLTGPSVVLKGHIADACIRMNEQPRRAHIRGLKRNDAK
ncbi:hypothetical protein HPB49_003335 [Dermacentor silvarum]|uniref:Uncharacterized protein n=1 Tax=Dermacentor silvarum TaxID=543639 RepID=A0ACB8C184_DERSI|nr:hypothetical protein HPB49_003335 [Dermacentor silvarum]